MRERADATSDLSRELLDLLEETRRRYLLYCLYLYTNPVRLPDIAYQITVWETDEATDDVATDRCQTYMSLYHDHLPALAEAGIVEYDQQSDMVELTVGEATLKRALERHLAREIDALLAAEHTTFEGDTRAGSFDSLSQVLAAPARRQLLSTLLDRPQIPVEEAATRLAEHEATDGSGDGRPDRDRLRSELYHVHLPRLEEVGLVAYDEESETIRLSPLSGAARDAIRTATRNQRLAPSARSNADGRPDQVSGVADRDSRQG